MGQGGAGVQSKDRQPASRPVSCPSATTVGSSGKSCQLSKPRFPHPRVGATMGPLIELWGGRMS